MTISEVIRQLEELKYIYGDDTEIVVQYRDDGGDYEGYDENVYMTVETVDGKNTIVM